MLVKQPNRNKLIQTGADQYLTCSIQKLICVRTGSKNPISLFDAFKAVIVESMSRADKNHGFPPKLRTGHAVMRKEQAGHLNHFLKPARWLPLVDSNSLKVGDPLSV